MTKAKSSAKGKEVSMPPDEKLTHRSSRNIKHHTSTSYETPVEIPDDLNCNSARSHTRTHDQVIHDHAGSHNSLHIDHTDFDDDAYWNDPALLAEIDRVFAKLESRSCSRSHSN